MGLLDSITSSPTFSQVTQVGQSALDTAGEVAEQAKQSVTQLVPEQYKDGFEFAAGQLTNDVAKTGIGDAVAPLQLKSEEGAYKMVDDAVRAGDYGKARAYLNSVKSGGRASVEHDAFPDTKNQSVVNNGDRSTTFKKFDPVSNASIADTKLAQVDQAEKMSKLVGHPIDPHNVNDVKSYFDKLSAQKPPVPTSQIQQEYGDYVKNFYVHPGGVDWGKGTNVGDRTNPTTLTNLLKDQPRDVSGKTTLDCEGHSYLTGAIFGNNPRFDVTYAYNSSHISAAVMDKSGFGGFTCNTLDTPAVKAANVTNGPQLLKLAGGDYSKAHEVWARGILSPSGSPNKASHDIAVADAQNFD